MFHEITPNTRALHLEFSEHKEFKKDYCAVQHVQGVQDDKITQTGSKIRRMKTYDILADRHMTMLWWENVISIGGLTSGHRETSSISLPLLLLMCNVGCLPLFQPHKLTHFDDP